jgi:hypothetical protein
MTLNDIVIPAGWTAFYDPATKKANGYMAFPNGGKAKTALSLLSADTEANLRAAAAAQGITLPAAATEPTKPAVK